MLVYNFDSLKKFRRTANYAEKPLLKRVRILKFFLVILLKKKKKMALSLGTRRTIHIENRS